MFFTSLKEHFVDAISAGVREVERKMEDAKAHIRGRDEDSFTEKAEKFMRLVNHSSHDVRIAACQDLARSAVFAKRSQARRTTISRPALTCSFVPDTLSTTLHSKPHTLRSTHPDRIKVSRADRHTPGTTLPALPLRCSDSPASQCRSAAAPCATTDRAAAPLAAACCSRHRACTVGPASACRIDAVLLGATSAAVL